MLTRLILATALVVVSAPQGSAATFYVSTNGGDDSPGNEAQPWRTIQKAANTMSAGDTVYVQSGHFDERVTTVRGGTAPENRITFRAIGTVTMKGFSVQHPFITVDGFDITGATSPSNSDAYVAVSKTGDWFELLNCTVRDGIQAVRNDMVFEPPNKISSPSGGFLAAGFVPGMTVQFYRATNVALANGEKSFLVSSVTDTSLVFATSTIVADGPKPAYLTGSAIYGLYLADGTDNCLFRSNRFSNLSYRYWFVQGSNHLFEANILEHNNGWDLIFFMGADHKFVRNLFQNNSWGTYIPSPDVFDCWPVKYERITFSNNFVINMKGVINAQKYNATVSGPFWIKNNVFVDVGWLSIRMPNTTFENNTLLRVARQANVLVQVEKHPLIFDLGDYATNAVIRNNIFVDCGQATGATTPDQVGWYRFLGPTNTVTLENNFVAGSAPNYGAKTGFPEPDPTLNGGYPGFVNLDDPLGPDGVPFTADDGLRLRADSKLVGKGAGLVDLGAYNTRPPLPRLSIALSPPANIQLSWPTSANTFELQSALTLTSSWSAVEVAPTIEGSSFVTTLGHTNPTTFFRLRQVP